MPPGFPNQPPPWAPLTVPPSYQGGYTSRRDPNVLRTPHDPQAVPQEDVFYPPGSDPEAPDMPYGMGDARCFLDIPPLVHFADGSTCTNPDYSALYRFTLSALARDPGTTETSLVPDPLIGPGETVQFQLTVEREENGMGHFLINELLMNTNPGDGIEGLLVEVKTLQGDMVYTNAPAPALHIFGTSFLSCCMPCPLMLYPNQTLIFSVTNRSIPAVDVRVRIDARGRRFMPYHNMGLVQEMERCWSSIQSAPYWLSFDNDDSANDLGLRIAASGASARGQMSVPGGGFLELGRPMVQVVSDVPGLATARTMEVEVTDGRIGKRFMDGPINLGAHYATETLSVPGFPGGLFRASQACHCPPAPHLVRGNTRLIHDLVNNGTSAAFVRVTYASCYHFADRCPPQRDLDLVRRYGSGDANSLRRAQKAGHRVYFDFLDDNPLYVEETVECAAPSGQAQIEEPWSPPAAGQGGPPAQFNGLGGLGDHGEWEAI